MSFRERDIEIQLSDVSTGKAYQILRGFYTQAHIDNVQGESAANAVVKIHGLSFDNVNQLTQSGVTTRILQNTGITIRAIAIDADGNEDAKQVYSGIIADGIADYSSMTEAQVIITSNGGMTLRATPANGYSYIGQIPAHQIIADVAKRCNLTLTISGKNIVLTNHYLSGDLMTQLNNICSSAGLFYALNGDKLTVYDDVSTAATTEQIISVETGLVGYPAVSANTIALRTLFNNDVSIGGTIKVQSIIPNANGSFQVQRISHSLIANSPNQASDWFTDIIATRPQN